MIIYLEEVFGICLHLVLTSLNPPKCQVLHVDEQNMQNFLFWWILGINCCD